MNKNYINDKYDLENKHYNEDMEYKPDLCDINDIEHIR